MAGKQKKYDRELLLIAFAGIKLLESSTKIVQPDNISASMVDESLIAQLDGSVWSGAHSATVAVKQDGQEQTYLFFYLTDNRWDDLVTSSKAFSEYTLTQLSCLYNTYILLAGGADIDALKQAIAAYPEQHGFQTTAYTLAEEYEVYHGETQSLTVRQIGLAVFISVMALTSITVVFTTNALLKRRQYGILLASGFTRRNITAGIAAEITMVVFPSTVLSWLVKLVEFERGTDPFRNVLLEAHIRYTLPVCLLIAAALIGIAALLPAIKVFQYQPSELIGGDEHGAD